MRIASLSVLFLCASAAVAADPEPRPNPRQVLARELTLPAVGLPPLGKDGRPTLDLSGTNLQKYKDGAKADAAVRKALRSAQVALWAGSGEQAPAALRAEVAAMRKKSSIKPEALAIRYGIPADDREARFKQEVADNGKELSRVCALLEDALEALAAVAAQADAQGSRWQAHRALLMLWLSRRLVSLEAHQGALGRMRKELPTYDAGKHSAWQLVPVEAEKDSSAKRYLKQAAVLALSLKKFHPNTAWDKLAQEAMKAELGAEWRAVK